MVQQYLERLDYHAALCCTKCERMGLAMPLNNLAWFLANTPDERLRDPVHGVQLASQAVKQAPDCATYLNTLGVAHYRHGDWKATLAALEKATQLNQQKRDAAALSLDGVNFFFLAMAHQQLGHRDQARRHYEQAIQAMDEFQHILELADQASAYLPVWLQHQPLQAAFASGSVLTGFRPASQNPQNSVEDLVQARQEAEKLLQIK